MLDEGQLNEIFVNISKGNLTVYCFKYGLHDLDPNKSKLLESSDEIHMNITTSFTGNENNKLIVSLGQFTSNKDEGTVKISSKQYLNNDLVYKNKEQRFRPYTQLVLVPMDKVKEYPDATLFCAEKDLDGINIQQQLITAIKKNESTLRANPIRKYHTFTREYLQEISENYIDKKLKDYEQLFYKLKNKLNSLSEDKKKEKIKIMENQLKNAENCQKTNQVLNLLSLEYLEMRKHITKILKNENDNEK